MVERVVKLVSASVIQFLKPAENVARILRRLHYDICARDFDRLIRQPYR